MRGPCFRSALAAAGIGLAAILCGPSALKAAPAAPIAPGPASAADESALAHSVVSAARKQAAAGDLDGAVHAIAAFLAVHPGSVEALRYLGDLYYRQSDFQTAERTYLAVLKIAPDDRATHDRLGGIYASQDRIKDAIDEFTKSLPNPAGYVQLVQVHRRLGDLEQFEWRAARAADNISDSVAQFAYGAILVADHRPLESIPYLQTALRLTLTPSACAPLSELGAAYYDLGWIDQSIESLQECLDRDKTNYDSLITLSAAYLSRNNFAKARDALQRAEASRPDGPEVQINYGYLEDVQNHWDKAVSYYLHAISLDPFARDAYVNLGYDYDEHRLYPLAEAAYLKGLSVSPDDGRLSYLLGVTYAKQGKRNLARVQFERAIKSNEPEVAKAAATRLAQT